MALIEDIRRDLERGTVQMIRDYHDILLEDAMNVVGDRDSAEDVVFATFEDAIRCLDNYDEAKGRFIDWLKGICRNQGLRHIRGKMRKSTVPVPPEALEEMEMDVNGSTELDLFAKSDAELLHKAIDELPDEMREAIILRYMSDLPIVKIAEFLKISPGTVKVRLMRARRALYAKLRHQIEHPKPLTVILALVATVIVSAAVVIGGISGGRSSGPTMDVDVPARKDAKAPVPADCVSFERVSTNVLTDASGIGETMDRNSGRTLSSAGGLSPAATHEQKESTMELTNTIMTAAMSATLMATANTIRIMPLGDSITSGVGSEETAGYRGPLWTELKDQGYEVDFVGTRTDYSIDGVDGDHCGFPGWGVGGPVNSRNGLYENISSWFASIGAPHVILLHIGSNDAGDSSRFADILTHYGMLLDRIYAAQPDARVIASTLLWRGDNPARLSLIQNVFNAGVTNLVAQQVAKGQHVSLVDLYSAVSEEREFFSQDGVHPNAAGYRRIADAWAAEITRLFPSPEAVPMENAPAVVNAVTDAGADYTSATIWFNQPMDAASCARASAYRLSDDTFGLPEVMLINNRTVCLRWSKSAYGRQLTLTVDGVATASGGKTIPGQQLPFAFLGAGSVVWEMPQNITGDSDVVTEGDLLYAYTQSSEETTVNGVTFKAGNGGGNFPASEKLQNLGVANFANWYSAFLPDEVECPQGMSDGYRRLINCGVYKVTSTESTTLTLHNLIPGHRYLVQIWSNDSRSQPTTVNGDTGVGLDNQVSIRYRVPGTSFGQYAVGRFLAEGEETTITMRATGSAGLSIAYNSVQVRDISSSAIRWEPVKTIYDDSDVHAEGTLIGAYNGSAGNSFTVNGVAFAGIGSGAGGMTDACRLVSPVNESIRNYYNASAPLNAGAGYPNTATDAYKGMLGVLCYVSGTTMNLEMKRLVPGGRYLVQLWYNDSRNSGYKTYMRIDKRRELDCQDFDNDRRGQHVTGRFTATSPTMVISLDGLQHGGNGGNASLVALQLRRLDSGLTSSSGWTGWKYAKNETDVETAGIKVYACTPGNVDLTVNGVIFNRQNGEMSIWENGNIHISGMHNYHDNAFMNQYEGPDLGTYRQLLQKALYSQYAQCPELMSIMTFGGLKPYTRYLLQVWVNDNRPGIGDRPAVEFGTGTRIPYRSPEDPHLGPIGYARIVTGDNTSYAITNVYGVVIGYAGSYSCPQINALQLREMPSLIDSETTGCLEWEGYGEPWSDVAGQRTVAVLSHGGTMELTGSAYCGGIFSSGEVAVRGEGGIKCEGEISAPTCRVETVWMSEDISRAVPGLTILAGGVSGLRQIVVASGRIDCAVPGGMAVSGVSIASGATLGVKSDLTTTGFACAAGGVLAFEDAGALILQENANLDGVVFDLRRHQPSSTKPFLRKPMMNLDEEPEFVFANTTFKVDRRIGMDGVESWYLLRQNATLILVR